MIRALHAHLQEALHRCSLVNYVRRMCVNCVQVAVEPQPTLSQHTSYARNYTKLHLCRAS
jgi:hypothetical protein